MPDHDVASAASDLPRYRDLETYLRREYRASEAPVEIDGITYITSVFEPQVGDDVSYALVDAEGLPTTRSSLLRRFGSFVAEYLSQLREVLAFSEPFPPSHRSYLLTEFVEPTFQVRRGAGFSTEGILSWKDVENHARLVLLGPPGIGKTSCLRMLALQETKKRDDERSARLPVYLQLRDLSQERDLLDVAIRALGGRQDEHIWEEVVKSGRLLLLLDGADELNPSSRGWLLEQVLSLSSRFPAVGIILAARNAGSEWDLPGFTLLEVEPFDSARQREWITRRVRRTSRTLERDLLTLVTTSTGLAELAGNPLLLAIAAAYVERVRTAPPRASTLMLRYIDALVEDWDQARGVTRWTPFPFPKEKKLEMLCHTAFKAFEGDRSTFLQEEFVDWEAAWSARNTAVHAIETLWHHSELLVPVSPGGSTWRFSHPILKELLAAKYLVERPDDLFPRLAETVALEKLNAVWTFACEMTSDATPLIEFMIHQHHGAELARAALIARVLLEGANAPSDSVSRGCDFVVSAVERIEDCVSVERNEGDAHRWLLEFKWTGPLEPSEGQLRGFSKLVRTLATGISTERRREVARRLSEAGVDVAKAIGSRMEKGSKVAERIDMPSRRTVIEGSFVDSIAS